MAEVVEGGDTIAEQERRAFSLLRRGDVRGALRECQSLAAERRTVRVQLLAAEAEVCLGRGDVDELDRIGELIGTAGGDERLQLRLDAARADHHCSLGSPLSGTIAEGALARFDPSLLLSSEMLWARGRLYRAMAYASALGEDDGASRSLALLERAQADLQAGGYAAEAARTAAEVRVARVMGFADDYETARDIVVECLHRQRLLDSSYVDVVLACRVVLDLLVGDITAMVSGADELARMEADRPLHPAAGLFVSATRISSRLVGEGPTPDVLAAIDEHLALVRAHSPPLASSQFVGLAATLIDAGNVEPAHLAQARRWANQSLAAVPVSARTKHDLAALLTRLDLLERRDAAAVAAIDADLADARRRGLRRDSAQRALRAALAARRIGRDDVAERLYLEALADLPPPHRRIFWENAFLATVVATRAPPATDPPAPLLRLLGPAVTIEAATTVTLSAGLARLVVALVTEGGAAPVDRLVDVLWPDVDLDAGRARLRVGLHRLRRHLRTSPEDDPLPRRSGLVTLAPSIDVDTMRFEKLAAGSTADRRAAIDLYADDVAWSQLAYDDVAAPLRRRLAMIWREIAGEALADPTLPERTVAHIAHVARREAPADPALAALLGRAVDRL